MKLRPFGHARRWPSKAPRTKQRGFLNLASGGWGSNPSGGGGGGGGDITAPWRFPSGYFEPAMFPLEVTFPKQGLTGTIYRPQVQHPGVPLKFPIGMFGGAPPFHFTIETAPAGTTIGADWWDTDYGVLYNPGLSAGTHTFRVRVDDQDGNFVTCEWNTVADAANWVVLDDINGNNANPGTLASPKKTLAGIFGADKHDTTYSGKAVLCRGGAGASYTTTGVPTELGAGDSGLKPRVAFLGTNKPNIWCLYPGESADFDFSAAGIFHYGSESSVRIWWDGFNLKNPSTVGGEKALAFVGSSSDTGFYNLGASDNATPVDSNNTFIFSAIDSTNGQRLLISHCRPTSCRRIFCELYGVNKVTFQFNRFTGFTAGSRGYYAKSDVENQCIWFNETYGTNDTTVGNAEGNGFIMIDNYINGSTGKTGGNAFVTRNAIKVIYCAFLCGQQANALQPVTEAFNTWHCKFIMHRFAAGPGPVAHKNSIIRHDGTHTNGIYDDSPAFPRTYANMLYATSGVIDDTTLTLAGVDRATYLGLRGHELSRDVLGFYADAFTSYTQYYLDLDAGSDASDGLSAVTAKRTWQAGLNLMTAKGCRLNVVGRAGAGIAADLTMPTATGGTGKRVISGLPSLSPEAMPTMNFGGVAGRTFRPNSIAHCDDLVIRKIEFTGSNQAGCMVFDYDYTFQNALVEYCKFPHLFRFDGDNCAHIHLHGAVSVNGSIANTGVIIQQNYFKSITGSAGANLCNIQAYQTPGVRVRRNDFAGRSADAANVTGCAVFIKKGAPIGTTAPGWIVEDNRIRGYYAAIYQSISGAGEDARHLAHIHRSNLIDDVTLAFQDNAYEASGVSSDHEFYQNTLGLTAQYGVNTLGVSGMKAHSNVFMTSTRRLTTQNSLSPARGATVAEFDYNAHYSGAGLSWVLAQYSDGGTEVTYTTLAGIRGAFPGRPEPLADLEENSQTFASLTTDFVNPTGGVYSLLPGSSLRTAGKGGTRMGYDETKNGPNWASITTGSEFAMLDFESLANGADVSGMVAAPAGDVATGGFWAAQGTGAYAGGTSGCYGDTAVKRAGKASSLRMSIIAGSTGRPGDGANVAEGDFGFIRKFPANVSEGGVIRLAVLVRIPSGFNFLTSTGFLKLLRLEHALGKFDLEVLNGLLDGLSPNTQQYGWCYFNEIQGQAQGETCHRGDTIFTLGSWQILQLAMKCSNTPAQGWWRAWLGDTMIAESVGGSSMTYRHTDGSYQTVSYALPVPTLPAGGNIRNFYLGTYWNGGSPVNQSVHVAKVLFLNNNETAGDLALDVRGNRYIPTTHPVWL